MAELLSLRALPTPSQLWRVALLALGAQLLLFAISYWEPDAANHPFEFFGFFVYWAATIALAIVLACSLYAQRHAQSDMQRNFWMLVNLSLTCGLVAELIEFYYYQFGISHIYDYNDIIYFLQKFTIIFLQLRIFSNIIAKGGIRSLSFDIFTALLSVGTIFWFSLQRESGVIYEHFTATEIGALALYVLTDSIILLNFITILVRGDSGLFGVSRMTQTLVFLGLAGLSVGDFIWVIEKLREEQMTPASTSLFIYRSAYILLTLGVLHFLRYRARDFDFIHRESHDLFDALSPLIQVICTLTLIYMLGQQHLGDGGRTIYLMVSIIMLSLMARQVFIFRDQIHLRTRLAVSSTEARMMLWYRDYAPLQDRAQEGKSFLDSQRLTSNIWLDEETRAQLQNAAFTPGDAREGQILKLARHNVEENLAKALEQGWFVPWYQPVHDHVRGRIVSLEVLARCHHPHYGILQPDDFIPFIETSGYSNILVRQLARRAFEDFITLRALFPEAEDFTLALNFTANDFTDLALGDYLTDLLDKYHMAPNRLCIELTERSAMNPQQLARFDITRLRAKGVLIGIDDFGTGYSSLSYLDMFKPDLLKIDKSFISDIETRATSMELVSSIIQLADRLDIQVVVEGIETAAQLAIVSKAGARLMQGYYFSRPMNFETLRQHVLTPASA